LISFYFSNHEILRIYVSSENHSQLRCENISNDGIKRLISARCLKIGKEAIWVGIGQASAAAGSLIGLRVLTEALGPTQFGELALGLTVVSLIGLVIFAGPGLATMRFFASALDSKQFNSFIYASWRVLLRRVWLMMALAGFALLAMWVTEHTQWIGLIIATLVMALATAFTTILDGIQNAARQRVVVALHSGMGQWFRFLIALSLFPFLGRNSSTAMWGYAMAAMLVLSSQFFFFMRYRRRYMPAQFAMTEDNLTQWTRKLGDYAFPVGLFGIFAWLQLSSERWALQAFTGTASVGLYAALSQVGYGPMVLLSNISTQLMGPILFNRAGDGSDRKRLAYSHRLNLQLIGVFFLFTIMAVLLALRFHEVIFSLFVAPEFREVSYLMATLVLSGGLFNCGQMASFLLLSGTETRSLLVPKIGSSVLGSVMAFGFSRLFGLMGVAWASALFSLCYVMWMLWGAWHRGCLPLSYPRHEQVEGEGNTK
jgi:O-antigen/teichoic acid export membrane protein